MTERKNKLQNTENKVAPTHVYVRLGPEQRVKVELPMSLSTRKTLAELVRPRVR